MNDPKRIAIVIVGLIFFALCTFSIKNHMDSAGYKNQVNYTTAVRSTEKDNFNYIVDSEQGRVLANGTFTTDSAKSAKFPEMTKGFTYVSRVKEHYTEHESCSTDEDGDESCSTYHSWDSVSSDEVYADTISFMARVYPTTLFNYSRYKALTDACSFTEAGSGTGWFESKRGCIDGSFYLDNDDRYVYSTVPLSFNASFLATTYGGLNPFNEKSITLENKSIEQILQDVGKYKLLSFWVLIVMSIILTIGAGIGAYQWVMQDGMWSTKE